MSFLCFWKKRRDNLPSPSSSSSLSSTTSTPSSSQLSGVSIIGLGSFDIDHFMQTEKSVEDECRHKRMNEERIRLNEIMQCKARKEIEKLKKYNIHDLGDDGGITTT